MCLQGQRSPSRPSSINLQLLLAYCPTQRVTLILVPLSNLFSSCSWQLYPSCPALNSYSAACMQGQSISPGKSLTSHRKAQLTFRVPHITMKIVLCSIAILSMKQRTLMFKLSHGCEVPSYMQQGVSNMYSCLISSYMSVQYIFRVWTTALKKFCILAGLYIALSYTEVCLHSEKTL